MADNQDLLYGLKDLNKSGALNALRYPYFNFEDMKLLLNRIHAEGLTVNGIECMVGENSDEYFTTVDCTEQRFRGLPRSSWYLEAFDLLVKDLKRHDLLSGAAFSCSIAPVD